MSDPVLPSQRNHPDTAHAAGEKTENRSQAETDRRLILQILTDTDGDGHTSDEISTYIEATQPGRICPPNQVSSRLGELQKEHKVQWIPNGFDVEGKQLWLQRLTRRDSAANVYAISKEALA